MNTKNIKNTSLSLLGSAISLVLITSTTQVHAASDDSLEKCAGVVKAGLNDCASNEHVCAGLNTDDGNEEDWIWLPKGTCEKLTRGEIKATEKKVVDEITSQMDSSEPS